MAYLYETHLHTKEGSACGISRGRDYIQRYLDLGYTGIIITDHFFRGSCAVSRYLRWDKWVHEFCRGYENAREEGARRGLDVFFGWEETFDGDDYLVYGLDKQWLLEHPEAVGWTRKEQFEETRRWGGCVVQAHPFRQYHYIGRISLSGAVDAVEAANGANQRSFDALAWAYAKKLNLPVTAGSDIHRVDDMYGDNVLGVYLDKRMETIGDYVDVIRNNSIKKLKAPPGRFDLKGDERLLLPIEIREEQNHSVVKNFSGFLKK